MSATFMSLCWKSCPEFLIPLIAHCMELLRDPLRPEVSPMGIFACHHYSALKSTFVRTDTQDKGEASSSIYTSLNSPLLCPWILLGENKIIYLIFNWKIIASFFTHCKFVFKDTCQQSAKSHSFLELC